MNLKIIHERYLPRPARGAVAGNDYTNPTVRAAQGLITQQQRFFEVTGKWPKGYRPTAGDLEVVRADMEAGYHNHRVTNPSSNPGKQNLSPGKRGVLYRQRIEMLEMLITHIKSSF